MFTTDSLQSQFANIRANLLIICLKGKMKPSRNKAIAVLCILASLFYLACFGHLHLFHDHIPVFLEHIICEARKKPLRGQITACSAF